jgi:hypothetical protein
LKIIERQHAPASSTLHRRLLNIGRAIGVAAVLLTVTLFALGFLTTLGLYSSFYGRLYTTLDIIFATVCYVLAGAIFWHRSDHPMALFSVLVLALFGSTYPNAWLTLETLHPVLGWLSSVLEALSIVTMFFFFYLFPDGRFVPRWTRWLAVPWIAYIIANFFPDAPFNPDNWPQLPYILLLLGWLLIGLFAQVYRYRRVSGPVERQQTKWVLFGFTVGLLGMLVVLLLYQIFWSGGESGSLASFAVLIAVYCFIVLIPLSIGVAILRCRLWDIDILINRTLVYGTLTATLGLLYYLGVVLLQAPLSGLIAQGSQLAATASTLAVVALFMPLRRRIQKFIDKRFFRTKYDARKTLEAFGARVRDEADLQKLSEALTEVVDETMKPSHVSLWLKPPPKKNKP